MPRDWTDPKPNYQKKRRLQHFPDKGLECPYCPENLGSNLMLARHVLTIHNFSNPEKKEVQDQ